MSLPGLSSAAVTVLGAPGSTASVVLHDSGSFAENTRVTTAAFRLSSDGFAYTGVDGSYAQTEQWRLSGASSSYAAFATVISGSVSGPTGVETSLGANVTWSVTDATANGTPVTASLTVQIRDAASHAVLASATITLKADRI